MNDEPTPYARALVVEYQMCLASGQHGRILTIVEELTHLGWTYDDAAGQLVRIKETAIVPPAPETPEQPKRRGRKAADG